MTSFSGPAEPCSAPTDRPAARLGRAVRRAAAAWVAFALLHAACAAAEAPLAVEEVAPGVFVHVGAVELATPANRGDIANLGFVVGGDAVAVIDTGGSAAEGRALLAAVRQATGKPIRYVINTHMHPDHIFGNAAFRGLGAQFVGAARLPEALAARERFYLDALREQIGDELAADSEVIRPDLLVEDRLTLDLGGRLVDLRAWPAAHTDNDLTLFDRSTATLFAGDLVFLEHLPALDGSLRGWLAVSEQLAALPAERVVPGHGPASAPWPEAIAPQRRYLEALARDVRRLVQAGAAIADAPAQAAPEERGRWRLFDEFHARNVTAAFAELEWE